jgi:hypothetical protein
MHKSGNLVQDNTDQENIKKAFRLTGMLFL